MGYERVVDEKVELSVGDLGDLLVAFLDALGVGNVEGYKTHTKGLHLSEDRSVAGRRDDVNAYMVEYALVRTVKSKCEEFGLEGRLIKHGTA